MRSPMKKSAKPAQPSNAVSSAGRPRIEIDKTLLRALAAIGATEEEIVAGLVAGGVKLDLRTLKRRLQEEEYRDEWVQGRSEFKLSLRRLQYRHARMPNSAGVTMTIHMSKHQLGETEKAALELSGRVDSNVEVNTSARDRVIRKLDTLAERITRRVDGIAAAAGANRPAREPVGN